MPAITALPPVPTRADPTNFAAKADALLTALEDPFVPELNALSDDVTAKSDQVALDVVTTTNAKDAALSSSNFKGAWSSLTGALNIPASVSHSGKIWLLTANLADVTTATPGVSGSWLDISNFFNGISTLDGVKSAISLGETTGENLIVNGDGRVNQRDYVSGTLVMSGFTLDRWKTFGLYSLTFTTSGNKRIMTATSIRQTVPGSDISGGTYVLNWTGTASCNVNASAYTKGTPITLTAGSNVTVEFSSGTFTDVQLEKGSVPTPFRTRSYQEELARCQYFYERRFGTGAIGIRSYGSASDSAFQVLSFGKKYATPTITKVGTWSVTNCGQPTITDITDQTCIIRSTVTATGTYTYSTGAGQGIEIAADL